MPPRPGKFCEKSVRSARVGFLRNDSFRSPALSLVHTFLNVGVKRVVGIRKGEKKKYDVRLFIPYAYAKQNSSVRLDAFSVSLSLSLSRVKFNLHDIHIDRFSQKRHSCRIGLVYIQTREEVLRPGEARRIGEKS